MPVQCVYSKESSHALPECFTGNLEHNAILHNTAARCCLREQQKYFIAQRKIFHCCFTIVQLFAIYSCFLSIEYFSTWNPSLPLNEQRCCELMANYRTLLVDPLNTHLLDTEKYFSKITLCLSVFYLRHPI